MRGRSCESSRSATDSLPMPGAPMRVPAQCAPSAFALSDAGRTIFQNNGFLAVDALFGGDIDAVPESLRHRFRGTYTSPTIG